MVRARRFSIRERSKGATSIGHGPLRGVPELREAFASPSKFGRTMPGQPLRATFSPQMQTPRTPWRLMWSRSLRSIQEHEGVLAEQPEAVSIHATRTFQPPHNSRWGSICGQRMVFATVHQSHNCGFALRVHSKQANPQ